MAIREYSSVQLIIKILILNTLHLMKVIRARHQYQLVSALNLHSL